MSAHSDGPRRGSEFVVRLPVSMQEGMGDERPDAPGLSADAVNVLVVDDQPDLADCVALLVDTLGHRGDPMLSKVRLVALTGYGREEDRARVLEAGFDQHVTKPVADAKLRDLLDGVAAARRRGN